ncbi:hypothetical protein [Streptomyces sp. NPDC094437]|uniref:hypothetical protein n=1 Tax=Streptomyces sp. NPDC094437 TaxID=3366060 RepID=UPI00381319F1
MGFAIVLAAVLIAGAAGAVFAQRRSRARAAADPDGPGALADLSELDAEAEANRWLLRLGGSLVPPDAPTWATAGEAAGRALTDASECHRAARVQLAKARTAAEYAEVTRTARRGLGHVRTAREALGVAPETPAEVSGVGAIAGGNSLAGEAFSGGVGVNGPKPALI